MVKLTSYIAPVDGVYRISSTYRSIQVYTCINGTASSTAYPHMDGSQWISSSALYRLCRGDTVTVEANKLPNEPVTITIRRDTLSACSDINETIVCASDKKGALYYGS